MQLNPEEIASQRIALMGHVEEICEPQGFVPPVEVNIVDVGNQYDLEYDEVDFPAVPIILPVVLTFTDSRGVRVERTLHDRQKGGSFPAARSGGRPLEHHLYWLWVVAQWDRRWRGIFIETFLAADFSGAERHLRRLSKVASPAGREAGQADSA